MKLSHLVSLIGKWSNRMETTTGVLVALYLRLGELPESLLLAHH